MTMFRRVILALGVSAMSGACTPSSSGDGDPVPVENPAGGKGGAKGQPTGRGGAGGLGQSSGGAAGNVDPMVGIPDGGMVPPGGVVLPDGGSVTPPPGGTANYVPPKVVISELMYHAVLDEGPVEDQEFFEIANRTDAAVEIGGWKVGGTLTFIFPTKLTLAARQHVVVAKNPAKIAATWGLNVADIQGPYTGQLDNGPARLVLIDAAGAAIDDVSYRDTAPWPIGGDAFGASEGFLPAALKPITMHKSKGYSIERLSYEVSPNEPVNWTTSDLDKSTPGKPSPKLGTHAAIIETVVAVPMAAQDTAIVKNNDAVLIRALLSARGMAKAPEVEYFIDDFEITTEPRLKIAMTMGAKAWEAVIPAAPDRSVVRYRIIADRGTGKAETIGPRPTDPYAWYAYYVSPVIAGKTPVYEVFIGKKEWALMYTWIKAGRVPAGQCDPNPTWNDDVLATLVSNGRVYDVLARYQGSPYNRAGGPQILPANWPAAKLPTAPSPLLALSWHLKFPRYGKLDGKRKDLVLNKRAWECGFMTTHVGGALFESVGIPAPRVNFGRMYINGVYYHFMTDIEYPGEDMLQRFFPKTPLGDFFKVSGWNGEQGPYTWSDGRELSVKACPKFTPSQLYTYNYNRSSLDYKTNSDEAMVMVKAFNVAKAAGPDALKKFFTETFDFPMTMSYIATINWLIPWDDFFQNHFLYKRADGKWIFTPWDFDLMMGGFVSDADAKTVPKGTSAQSSFYIGEVGDRSNRTITTNTGTTAKPVLVTEYWVSYMKDAFIKTYREELHTRLRELSAKELLPAAVDKLVDDVASRYFMDEAMPSASQKFCTNAPMIAQIKQFARDRNARIAAGMFK